MERREYIAVAGASLAVGLSGCLGGDDTDSPEDVAEAWYEAIDERDADQLESLMHSETHEEVEDDDMDELDEIEYQVDVEDVEVVEEDLDSDEIADRFEDVDSEDAETITDDDTAVVEVEIEEEFELLGETAEETSTDEVLTAEEDGDWLVVAVESEDEECFITTATARDHQTLQSLRRYRDDWLTATWPGERLADVYYKISPPIARSLQKHPSSTPARATRTLVERCAALSNRQRETDSRVKGSLLGVTLLFLYVIGILTGLFGHLWLRASED